MAREKINAVTVSHNSSQFVELMLRSFFVAHRDLTCEIEFAILDNNSSPEEEVALRRYADSVGIKVTPTGFPFYIAGEQHGAALGDFVQEYPDCDYYLFLDADMWFLETETVSTMLGELQKQGGDCFAVQAQIHGYYLRAVYEGRDGVAGSTYWDGRAAWPIEFEGRKYVNRYMPRCSPVCSLFANTPLFRTLAGRFGLAPAIRFGIGEVYYYDTFSLLTEVLQSHGRRFVVSRKKVNHFGETSYGRGGRAVRDRDCERMLAELRTGRGLDAPVLREPQRTDAT
jgi:hypothetical protein